MDNFKIIHILRSLNRKDLRRFREFVESPYYNKNKPVKKLFSVLKKHYPDFKIKNISIENIYKKVFSGSKYSYTKINNVISDLYKLSEKFLAISHIENSEFYIERNIFFELRIRELYKIYKQKQDAYIKQLNKRSSKDEDFFYYHYENYREYLYFATSQTPNSRLDILQKSFDNFFNYSLIRFLRFYCFMLHEQHQNNFAYDFRLFDEIMDYINKNENRDSPVLLLYSTIIKMLITKEEKYYRQLWEIKKLYFDEFNREDIDFVYLHLFDYAAYMVNFKGEDSYNQDMHIINKEQLEKGMFPDGRLFPYFINDVKIACRVKDFEFTKKYINEFEKWLSDDVKKNTLEFCYGYIAFSQGRLTDALKHFSRSNFKNFIFRIQVKILLLETYYLLKMYDQAEAMIDTFSHYVAKEKNLLEEHRKSYNKFLNLMRSLIRLKESNKDDIRFQLDKMEKEARLIPSNPFRIKVWLIEEIKTMM